MVKEIKQIFVGFGTPHIYYFPVHVHYSATLFHHELLLFRSIVFTSRSTDVCTVQ